MTAPASAGPGQTPQQFVMSTARGAYTTVLVKEGSKLINWPKHVERLQRSLKAMHDAVHGMYGAYYDCLKAAPGPEAVLLQQQLGPPIREALQAARLANEAVQDFMLMVVLVPSAAQPHGLEVCTYAHPLGGPHCSSRAGSAVILGAPRSIPIGKDSGWVAERRPLEQQKGDAAEVLLCTRGGQVLEGLVTNLFVVAGTAAAPEVWTAGMQDGVVWGTVRAQVMQACRQLGIPVREEAPSMASRHEWREAFITNGLRVVQPLSSIACGKGNAFGHPAWELPFPAAPGPVTSAITAALIPLMPAVDAADL